MKKIVLVMMACVALSVSALAEKPNPADYKVTVHVISSTSLIGGAGTEGYVYQLVEVVIDGQRLQLRGYSAGVLALGDYPAKLSSAIHGPKNPNTYDVYRGYDFLMPDGKVRSYSVSRLGPQVVPN